MNRRERVQIESNQRCVVFASDIPAAVFVIERETVIALAAGDGIATNDDVFCGIDRDELARLDVDEHPMAARIVLRVSDIAAEWDRRDARVRARIDHGRRVAVFI